MVTSWLDVVQVVGLVTGQVGGQPLDSVLELRVFVDECSESGGQPLDAELLAAAPVFEFLNATVGEVHGSTTEGRGDQLALLDLVHLGRPRRGSCHGTPGYPP